MLEIKKLGEKTIHIANTSTGRSYTGSATYKASSVGGDTVCLQSIYDDNEPVFVAKVSDITIGGAAQTDVNACLVALNAFIGSFKGAATSGGGGVSPSGDWVLKIRTSTVPIEMTQAQVDELTRLLSEGKTIGHLFNHALMLTGRVEFKGLRSVKKNDAMESTFSGSCITYLGFPDLEELDGARSFARILLSDTDVREVSFPKLSKINRFSFVSSFAGTVSLSKATIHPAMIKKYEYDMYTPIYNAENLTNLTLTDTVTESSNLSNQKKLSSASVLHVLQQLDTATMGEAIQFGEIKIPATDPLKEQIRAAINARPNWTITGITVAA